MIPSPELELLLLCCRKDRNEQHHARLADLLHPQLDWEPLLRLARHHGMLPLLHHLLGTQQWRGVPPEQAAALKAAYRAHLIRNLEMAKQLFLLLDLLARHGVRALPVKGPVLAAQAFGDIGLRAFSDLDLLIAPGDLWQCCGLLREDGFVPEVELEPGTVRPFTAQETSLGFRHRARNLTIELHWNFLPRSFGRRYDFDRLWDGRRSVKLENRAVAALSDSDTMRHLLLHGFKHGWDRLCLVSDAAHAAASLHIDWDAVLADEASRTMSHSGLLLTELLVPGVIPGKAVVRARHDQAARRLAGRFAKLLLVRSPEARSIFRLGAAYVAGQKGIAGKLLFLWRTLFWATTEDWKRRHFHVALWRYPLLRPWRLLADHLVRPGP